MTHTLLASGRQNERWEEKEEAREAEMEIEKEFQCHKIIFIENNPMFPCLYSHTNTPTAFTPLTERLDKRDKSLCGELVSGESGPGRERVQGSHGVGKGVSRWWCECGFDQRWRY